MLSELYEIYRSLDDAVQVFTGIVSFINPRMSFFLAVLILALAFWVSFKVATHSLLGRHKEKPLLPPSPPSARDAKGSIITPPPSKVKKEPIQKNVGDVAIKQFEKLLYHKPNDGDKYPKDDKVVDDNKDL